jgi:hypothetical protein
MTCMFIYVRDSVSCVDYSGGSYCEVVPEYDWRCIGSIDVEGTVPEDPYVPGGTIPIYVDPALLYIEYIDDTDPESIKAVVSADTGLDHFALFMNGAPYGIGWGTGLVVVGSLPARDFNGGNANISVEGCGAQTPYCAAASATTYASDAQKVASSPVVVFWPEAGGIFSVASYDRSHVVRYKRRSYSTWSSPGNTQFTFTKALAALSYNWLGGQTVFRDEELTWHVRPGSWWPNTCTMTSEPAPGGFIDKPYTSTDWVACDLDGTTAGEGFFSSKIARIFRQQYEGVNHGAASSGDVLEVTVP